MANDIKNVAVYLPYEAGARTWDIILSIGEEVARYNAMSENLAWQDL
jgi:hypothetical protein